MHVLLNVFETPMPQFKVYKIPILADSKVIFQAIKELSYNRIADCAFFGGFLFFKGNPQKVINVLEKQRSQLESELFIRKDFEETTLMPHRDEKVIKGLLYSLFEGELYRKGWRAPIGKRKRALPQSFESNREFYLEIGKDAVVLFGLKYMFDISSDKNLRLWLDVYAPIWHISENRFYHLSIDI
jgi:hypothetical protein